MSKKPLNKLTEELNQPSAETPGQRIRKLRKEAGLKQNELARLLEFSSNYLGQVERDAKPLSKNLADAVCSYFHVDYNYLYFGIRQASPAEHSRIEEDPAHTHDFRTLLNICVQSCSEDECRMLEPVIRSLIQSLREIGWFDPRRAGQIKDES